MIRLTRWKWNPNKITGFIPDIVSILKKYSLWGYQDDYFQTRNFPCKFEGKGIVVQTLKKVENDEGGKKILYDQFQLNKHVIKELAPNMLLCFGLKNYKMAVKNYKMLKYCVDHSLYSLKVFHCKSCMWQLL